MKKILLKFCLLILLLGLLFITPVNAAPPNSPLNPQCEGETNPLLVYTTIPEFSWIFDDPDGGDTQSAYQILVSTSSDNLVLDIGDMWNSGKVLLSSSTVSYSGSELQGETNYYWKVRTWDVGDSAGSYCSIQTFKTAFFLLKESSQEADHTGTIALGDMDNDGDLDLIVGRSYYNQPNRTYKNNGSGSFSVFQSFGPVGWSDYTNYLILGDIDNDGDLDLITADRSQTRVYKNNGSGSLTEYSALTCNGNSVVLGDIDNDGDLDLVFGKYNSGNSVYKNDGSGNFNLWETSIEAGYTYSLALGDIDNDGDLDYIDGNYGRNGVYKNDGNGNFTFCESSLETDSTHSVALGDLDNDGDLDYIAGNDGQTNKIYKNNGNGSFYLYQSSLESDSTYQIALGDIDNDGDLDYIAGNNDSVNRIYKNNGNGNFTLYEDSLESNSTRAVALGDVDNDGDLDYIAGNYDQVNRVYVSGEAYANPNNAPSCPGSGLGSNYESGFISLSWDAGTDTETSADGLYYSLRVGTVSGSSDTVSGVYGTPLLGNYIRPKISASQLGVKLCSLTEDTTFYWRVQTIDTGLGKSLWSAEQSFYFPNDAPVAITDVVTTAGDEIGEVDLTWTAPGDDGLLGKASNYVVKYSTFQFTDQVSFDNATDYTQSWTPLWNGESESKILTGLTAGTTLYFAIEARDEKNNQGALSNIDGTNSVCITTQDDTPPGEITDLAAVTYIQAKLNWTAPGDNGYETDRSATGYIVKYSTTGNITNDTEFNNAVTYSQTWIPETTGTAEEKTLTGLNPGFVYYFSIKAYDENNNYAALSNPSNNNCIMGNFVLDTAQNLTGVNYSSLAWGDYDGDGDLDLVLCGATGNYQTGYNPTTKIYCNNSGTLVEVQTFVGVWGGDKGVNWGDYDRDGDLDLFLCGFTGSSYITRIYRNDNGTFNLDTGQSLPGAYYLALADYDNDGDLDLTLNILNYPDLYNKIYRNDNGVYYEDTNQDLIGVRGAFAWGDYDNDGDLDLIIAGEDFTNDEYWKLYRNDSSILNEAQNISTSNDGESIAWADYDNDGDLDLVVGMDGFHSNLYRNDNGVFIEAQVLPEAYTGSVSWGDYDNDGDFDLALTGYDGWSGSGLRVFSNDNGELTEMNILDAFSWGTCVVWGDYDNDGDLDLCINGSINGVIGHKTYIYKNLEADFAQANTIPDPPVVFNDDYDGILHLSWDDGSDSETPKDGLYYNIRVGTNLGEEDVISGQDNSPLLGNYLRPKISSNTLGINLILTEPTTYYWAVQTIDTSLRKSPWSEEQIWYPSSINQPPGMPINLQCEEQINPVKIWNWIPGFSWIFNDPNMDEQGAYQILVSTSPGKLASDIGDVWDSGKVSTSDNIITYSGSPLCGNTTYFWKIRTWDIIDSTGPYSGQQIFQTAFLFLNQTPDETDSTCSQCIGDIDDDGDLDIICGNTGANRIYKNNGSGIISLYQSSAETNDTCSIAIGDIDNDGDLDYIAGNYNQSNCVYKNNGAGSFSLFQTFTETYNTKAIALVDIDNDGNLDLIVGNNGQANCIYTNDGTGSFNLIQTFSYADDNTNSVAVGDMDNDGDIDLVIGNYGKNNRIYKNDGGGSFSLYESSLESDYTNSIVLGDLDNDGDLDLIVGNLYHYSGQYNRIYKNDGDANFSLFETSTEVYNTCSLALGDLDNDGDLDYIAGNYQHYIWSPNSYVPEPNHIYLNDGTGSFSLYESTLEEDYTLSVALGDMDGDGGLDCVVGNYGYYYYDGGWKWKGRKNSVYLSHKAAFNANQVPDSPTSFSCNYDAGILSLTWQDGTDTETFADGLYYNLKLGTSSGENDIVAGRYGSPLLGNYLRPKVSSTTLGVNLHNLPEGTTIYWSIQTIDTGLAASNWSVEQSTYIPNYPPNVPLNPFCEGQTNPDGISTLIPEFSWVYDGGDSQGDYQILVSTSQANLSLDIGDMWDTGKVTSSAEAVFYTGANLSVDTTYWWKVRCWDVVGSTGPYCSEQNFSAGFFLLKENSIETDNTYSVALGDIDNDGDLDYIAANYNQGNQVYKNNGTGSFTLSETSSEISYTHTILLGDIDNDGDLDYITGDGIDSGSTSIDRVRVYKNDGMGSFSLYQISGVWGNTGSLALGDIDNDGDLDLICGNRGPSSSSGQNNYIYKNDGEGSFTRSEISSEGDKTYSVVLGDIDSDGDLDYIAGNNGVNRVYTNNGGGVFSLYESSGEADDTRSVILIDIDNDGDLDLICGNYAQVNRVYKNDGSGSFSLFEISTETDNTTSLALADVDNDGDMDLLVGNKNQVCRLYKNDGNGSFILYCTQPETDNAFCVVMGDLDNDGDLEYIKGNYGEANRIFYSLEALSNPNQSPQPPASFNTDYIDDVLTLTWGDGTDIETSSNGLYYNLKVGTSTGSDDIVAGNYGSPLLGNYTRPKISSTTLGVNLQNLQGGTTLYWSIQTIDTGLMSSSWSVEQSTYIAAGGASAVPPDEPSTPLCEGKVNPTGVSDLTPEFSWIFSDPNIDDGDEQSAYHILVSTSTDNLAIDIGDMWDTGKVITDQTNNVSYQGLELQIDTTYYWKVRTWDVDNSSGPYCTEQTFKMSFYFLKESLAKAETNYAVVLGDIDNDGDLDLIFGNNSYNRIYKNDGTGSFALFESFAGDSYTYSIALGDVDNDGDMDLICGNYNYNYNQILKNDGTGSFILFETTEEDDRTYSVVLGDIDNNGDLDLICGNNGINRIYKNDGGGSFTLFESSSETDNTRAVVLSDIDNDGDLDLICGNSGVNRIYKNDGGGSFTLFESSTETDNTQSVVLSDIDNDGDMDLIYGNSGVNRIYKNDGGSSFTLHQSSTETDQTNSASSADIDNDGDMDLICGNYNGYNRIYTNDGTGNFTLLESSEEKDYTYPIALGDIDNDGDIDYIIGDYNYYSPHRVYCSNVAETNPNTSPNPPAAGFISDYTNNVLSLEWGDGSDTETSSDGLYYNLRIGTSTGGDNIVAQSYASPLLGNYIRPKISSTTLGINLNLSGDTTYYWSIQTIDSSLKASTWSTEQSTGCYIAPSPVIDLTASTNYEQGEIDLSWTATGDNGGTGDITEGKYRVHYSSNVLDTWDTSPYSLEWSMNTSPGNTDEKTVTGLIGGTTYYFWIKIADEVPLWSDVSNKTSSVAQTGDTTDPATISDLVATGCEQIKLVWTAPGDNGGEGTAANYEVKYATYNITSEALYNSAVTYVQSWGPLIGGSQEVKNIIGLIPGQTYYFSIKAYDEVALCGGISNTTGNEAISTNFYNDLAQTLTEVSESCLSWGDYDGDGDLDLALCGESDSGKITKVYRNDAGILNEAQSLTGVSYGSLSWGDYDNDGDLDLALCGDATGGRISKIYRNDAGTFSEVQSLTGIEKGSIAWADIDNDGDLDLAVSGDSISGGSSKIYRNDAGTFVEVQSLTGVERSALSWGDYDMDGDMDLVLSGYTGLVRITKIFRNEGSTLIENQNLVGIDSGALSWGDYDGDGDMDLALMGNPGSQRIAKIYRNDNGTFVEDTGQGLTGVDEGSLEWGDFDNDGDLDLVICGDTGTGYITKIYQNSGGTLSLIQELTGIRGSLKWGDYDLDGDLDLAICGDTGIDKISRLYKNTEADPSLGNNANSQPNAPGVLSSGYSDGVLTLTWNDGVDVESSANNLYYNVRVGTESASNDTVSGTYGSPLLGKYLRPKTTSSQLGIKITNLMEGTTYYWSLQSIDGGLRASAWAGEESIYIPDSIPGAPIFPQCEGETNPGLVYDITPEFSWVYQGSVNQGAYQILVATDSAVLSGDIGNMWDSGKVSSSASTDISYAGFDLQEETTYYWKVRCWDLDGSTGPYCGAQTFATDFFLIRESSVQTDNTNSIVFGDIDNDGDLDYIAGNYGSNRVYKNNGDATFALFQTPAGSYNTRAIAIGDMDNDGDLDYVDGAYNSRVYVYKNDGNGTFSSFYTSPTNYYTHSCALGDIDNDGDLDVIQGTDGQNRIYENDGTGTLSLIQSSAENDDTRSIVIGDLDNDGDLDYIAGNYGQVNRIYMNDGSGSFSLSSNSAEYDYTRVVVLGDIDNDGDLDLIYGNYSYANRIYKNDGTGSFSLWESSIEFDYTRSLSLGDINNDGYLDLIAGNYNQPNRLYTNDGNGSFILYHNSQKEDFTYCVVLGDLDNDGDLDYVSGNYGQANRVYTTGIAVSNANQSPSPPTSDFSSDYDYVTGVLTLNWGDGTDIETVSEGLCYQLRIGLVSYSGLGDDIILSGIYGSPLLGNYMRPNVSLTTLGINLNLSSGKNYYWSIKTIDSGLASSNWSVEQIFLKDGAPGEPFGVKYRLLSDGRKRIEWSRVTNDEDGTVCDDLAGYNIYRSMQLNGIWSRQNSSLITEEFWEEQENTAGVVYYIVRAVDDKSNESINSMTVSSLEEAIFISEGSLTRVVISKGISDILYKDSNSYGDDIKIEINKGADTEEIIEVYTFTPVRANGEESVEDFSFDLPEAEIIIVYEVEGGIVKGSKGVREEQAGKKLAMYRFNGLEWVKLGGKVSTEEDSISVKSKWLGSLCIMASERKEFDVIVRPRMFTPNGDRRNDICYIHFDNPEDKRNISCRIYDIRSALVRDLPVVYNFGAGYFYWDGKDNSGRKTRSGIYIYQIEVGNKAINGTLVIAR